MKIGLSLYFLLALAHSNHGTAIRFLYGSDGGEGDVFTGLEELPRLLLPGSRKKLCLRVALRVEDYKLNLMTNDRSIAWSVELNMRAVALGILTERNDASVK